MRSIIILKGLIKSEKIKWVEDEGLSDFLLDINNLRSLFFKPEYKGDGGYLVHSYDDLIYSNYMSAICSKASTGTMMVIDMENESTIIVEQLARIFGYTIFYKIFPAPSDYVNNNKKYQDKRYQPKSKGQLKSELDQFKSLCVSNKIETFHEVNYYWNSMSEIRELQENSKILHVSDLHSHWSILQDHLPCLNDFELTIFHGDYIDGPEKGGSRKIMDNIIKSNKDNVYYLEGNHEQRLRKYLGWKILKSADRKIAASCIYNLIPDIFLTTTAKEFEDLGTLESWDYLDAMNNKLREYVIYKVRGETYINTHCGIRWMEQLSPKYIGSLVNSNKNIERVDEAFAKNFAKDGFRSIHAHCYYPSGFNPTKYKGVINLDPENENCVNYFINDNSKLNKVICIEEQ